MTQSELVERLSSAFPRENTWARALGETYGPGGIDPAGVVHKVLYAVTVTRDVEDLFVEGGYDFLVLHHPFRPTRPIPHFVAHTALDCSPSGLNDIWRDALGMKETRPITDNLGHVGRIEAISFDELCGRVRAVSGHIEGQLRGPGRLVETVAVCTGLGGLIAREAAASGADVFITGELIQPAGSIRMPGIIEMGHTRSERIGVEAVRRVLGPSVLVDGAPLGVDRFQDEVYRSIH